MMNKNQSGQTLIALLFFIMVGVIATTSAIIILFTNLQSGQKVEDSERVRQLAELGVEKALINILRDASYSGETIEIDSDTILVSVSGDGSKLIYSTATSGDISRKIEVNANFSNNILTTTSWKELY